MGRLKTVISIAVIFLTLAATAGVANAGWTRGFSEVNTSANDEAVCEEGITLSANISYQTSNFEDTFPDFDATVDDSYPSGPTNIDLYATPGDATSFTSAIATVPVQTTLTTPGTTPGSAYIFDGEATIAAPAGYENGDVLYVWGYSEPDLILEAVPLTIGDEIYECDEAEPGPILGVVWPHIKTFQYLPSVLLFYANDIDPSTLTVAANDGTVGPVNVIGNFWGVGIGTILPQDIGVTCNTTSLDLEAETYSGDPLAGSIPVTVTGRNCRS